MYVDGFVAAVKRDRNDDYLKMAKISSDVFREHGATRTVECWEDDVQVGDLTSFPRAVQRADDEVCVFAWIEYPDRETRDECMRKSMEDPRFAEVMEDMPFDGKRMIFGGFRSIFEG